MPRHVRKLVTLPARGAYLTDGSRLLEVDDIDADGTYYLLDCAGDVGEIGTEVIAIAPVELTAAMAPRDGRKPLLTEVKPLADAA